MSGFVNESICFVVYASKTMKQNCKRKKMIKKEKDVLSEMQENVRRGKGKERWERSKDAHVLIIIIFELP